VAGQPLSFRMSGFLMAKIFPFRALRYDRRRVPVESAVTQPYDKITPAMQERYYAANPYNLVRIILGRDEAQDGAEENVYTRARDSFRQWRREGILAQDGAPSIYGYWQTFRAPGQSQSCQRRGFIALGKIEDYGAGVVFRHEQTLAKPKADRLNLLRATRAHFGQIFMLYSDPDGEVNALLTPLGEADVAVKDEYGAEHQLWRVSEPRVLDGVARLMAEKKVIIADGHHRYETALNYRDERRAEAGRADEEAPYERVMMTFVNMDAPGLVILPTHRVVFGLKGFAAGRLLEGLSRYFEVTALGPVWVNTLVGRLRESAAETVFCAVTKEGASLLTARPGAAEAILDGYSPRQRVLDVTQLHAVMLEAALGISREDVREQKHVLYLRDAEEAMAKVASGQADVAFLMNPVRIEQMRDVAFAGEVMPQKSTDFYPKLLSGLTIYALD